MAELHCLNDKRFNKQVKRCRPVFERWHRVILPGWDLTRTFFRGAFDSEKVDPDGSRPLMDISSQPQYLAATVRVDTYGVEDLSDSELDEYIRHELVHPILWELEHAPNAQARRWANERATTLVAKALGRAYEAGRQQGVKESRTKS